MKWNSVEWGNPLLGNFCDGIWVQDSCSIRVEMHLYPWFLHDAGTCWAGTVQTPPSSWVTRHTLWWSTCQSTIQVKWAGPCGLASARPSSLGTAPYYVCFLLICAFFFLFFILSPISSEHMIAEFSQSKCKTHCYISLPLVNCTFYFALNLLWSQFCSCKTYLKHAVQCECM